MSELHHYWGEDLSVSATGDLLVADVSKSGEQRVLRRLLTNPNLTAASGDVQASGDYTFHQEYGAGLPRLVGRPVDLAGATSLISAQMALEEVVSQSPAPQVDVTTITDGMNAVIRYNDAATASPVVLDFDVTK